MTMRHLDAVGTGAMVKTQTDDFVLIQSFKFSPGHWVLAEGW